MKFRMIFLIIMLLVALLIGGIIGYTINNMTTTLQVSQSTPQGKEDTLIENTHWVAPVNTTCPTNTTSENVHTIGPVNATTDTTIKDETSPYDGSKKIGINGKLYTISYSSDFYKYDQKYPLVVNLYFNNKKVRSINMPFQHGEPTKPDDINKEYSVELHNINNEYILVVIANESKTYDDEDAQLCVLNLNGEYIGSQHWERNEGVRLKSNNQQLVRYEVYKDGFLIFERFSQDKYVDMKYTIVNNRIESKQERFYSIDEVDTAGK